MRKQEALRLARAVDRNSKDLAVYIEQDWSDTHHLGDIEEVLGKIEREAKELRAGIRERMVALDPQTEFPED